MNAIVGKALVVLLVAGVLLGVAVRSFVRNRTAGSRLELIGACGLLVLGVTHVCEGLHLLPLMGWGFPKSPGHYLNVVSATAGVTLLPLGYIIERRRRRNPGAGA